MKLNHLSMTVDDVRAAHAFLQKYFGLESITCNQNMGFLRDDDGAVIVLASPRVTKESEVRYPGGFHIGFIQENEEQVNSIYQLLRDDGYAIDPPARIHGSWTFYCKAPGGFTVEVLR